MTLGEYRVGITFNPGGNPTVDEVKRLAAALIDRIHAIGEGHEEVGELKRIAMRAVEDAAMWAVKAATKPEQE